MYLYIVVAASPGVWRIFKINREMLACSVKIYEILGMFRKLEGNGPVTY